MCLAQLLQLCGLLGLGIGAQPSKQALIRRVQRLVSLRQVRQVLASLNQFPFELVDFRVQIGDALVGCFQSNLQTDRSGNGCLAVQTGHFRVALLDHFQPCHLRRHVFDLPTQAAKCLDVLEGPPLVDRCGFDKVSAQEVSHAANSLEIDAVAKGAQELAYIDPLLDVMQQLLHVGFRTRRDRGSASGIANMRAPEFGEKFPINRGFASIAQVFQVVL